MDGVVDAGLEKLPFTVLPNVTSSAGGAANATPEISLATFQYNDSVLWPSGNDISYAIHVSVADRAGNVFESVLEQEIYLDNQSPSVALLSESFNDNVIANQQAVLEGVVRAGATLEGQCRNGRACR